MPKKQQDRAKAVCQRCHDRKVRCDLENRSTNTCSNCARDGQPCRYHLGARKRRVQERQAGLAVPQGPVRPTPSSTRSQDPDITTLASSPQYSSGETHDAFIGDYSVLSWSADTTTQSNTVQLHATEANTVMRTLQADVLPTRAERDALCDFYFQELYHVLPVIDRQDLDSPSSSLLLRQALCFAGSMMRRGNDDKQRLLPQKLYLRIKTLIFLNSGSEPMTILKTLCVLSCWSPHPPEALLLDCPWQWLGQAISLAMQMGIYREKKLTSIAQGKYCRRIWWNLVINDTLQATCYGRPSRLHLEDSDVRLPETTDFGSPSLQAQIFCHLARLIIVLRRTRKLAARHGDVVSDEVSDILISLREWVHELPAEIQVTRNPGLSPGYNRPVAELHILNLCIIIVVCLLPGPLRCSSQLCAASIYASRCVVQLYDDILHHEHVPFLLPMHGWMLLVASVPQVYRQMKNPSKTSSSSEELEVLRTTLRLLGKKYPSADASLRKMDYLCSLDIAVSRLDGPISRVRTNAEGLDNALPDVMSLFALHHDLMSRFEDGEEVVEFGNGSAAAQSLWTETADLFLGGLDVSLFTLDNMDLPEDPSQWNYNESDFVSSQ